MYRRLLALFCLSVIPCLVEAADDIEAMKDSAKTGVFVLFIIALIPVLVIAFFVGRFIYNIAREGKKTSIKEDYENEAQGYADAGAYLMAAKIYEKNLKQYNKAVILYEKGGEYERAAALYDTMGMQGKAKEMYLKAGDIKSAAEITFLEGDFDEASRLYYDAGMKKDAAEVFERAGRRMAAVRIFRELDEYERAANLLEEEGLPREAAEMFSYVIRGVELDNSSAENYYRYASMLEVAGDKKTSSEIFKRIYLMDPAFRDVNKRVQESEHAGKDKAAEGKISLKGFIKSGKLDPRHGLKLWVQILRNITGAYESGLPFGYISTDNILIDKDNHISFVKKEPASVYVPPERSKGDELDIRADIFSLGVVLFEMLTGKLEGLGSERVIDLVDEVPEWLDEIVIRCIRKVKEDRYQDMDEIFDHLKTLSQKD
ncbi:MAG: hypothetical protein JSV21_01870 [Nitrospirota bacterium]|nr:MAG: hypothetical protein JSV21_01870 [Nitrospirota bacterium]